MGKKEICILISRHSWPNVRSKSLLPIGWKECCSEGWGWSGHVLPLKLCHHGWKVQKPESGEGRVRLSVGGKEANPRQVYSAVSPFRVSGSYSLVSVVRTAAKVLRSEGWAASWSILRQWLLLSQNGSWQHAVCSEGGHFGSAVARGGSAPQLSPDLATPIEAGKVCLSLFQGWWRWIRLGLL